ncbi:stage II sporulation protein R [Clostridium magnum]|uniref:Stage II sporulation protein SpoIIR n=1 Tax=Clostridium magnum DSM 2767 TaxID=1121326 RepID=A0A161YIA2_9CLOT|nr:stage II sporulation protein R [Clostridium magnum]KZL90062.1 stage II sporulation protein SpoIIR [Clostridium magnum DSM 2767]SHH59076.1 stage II sporulation protein R [Clostridium magnum DSM 2767]
MKKFLFMIICILVIFALNTNMTYGKGQDTQKDIASKIIRFHVIANSDSKSDQALKLKVRDKILEYMQPKLKNSKSIDESRKIIRQNNEKIIAIANKVIQENGYNYSVTSTLSNENFPIKTYGNITLPQGKYEAYRIIIGSGEGQNWWCVMFPPVCFVDITKGEVSYKQTEDQMKKVLSPEEYEIVNNQLSKSSNKKDIRIQFKLLEIFQNVKKLMV